MVCYRRAICLFSFEIWCARRLVGINSDSNPPEWFLSHLFQPHNIYLSERQAQNPAVRLPLAYPITVNGCFRHTIFMGYTNIRFKVVVIINKCIDWVSRKELDARRMTAIRSRFPSVERGSRRPRPAPAPQHGDPRSALAGSDRSCV